MRDDKVKQVSGCEHESPNVSSDVHESERALCPSHLNLQPVVFPLAKGESAINTVSTEGFR